MLQNDQKVVKIRLKKVLKIAPFCSKIYFLDQKWTFNTVCPLALCPLSIVLQVLSLLYIDLHLKISMSSSKIPLAIKRCLQNVERVTCCKVKWLQGPLEISSHRLLCIVTKIPWRSQKWKDDKFRFRSDKNKDPAHYTHLNLLNNKWTLL